MLETSPEAVRSVVLDVQGLRTSAPSKSIMDVAHRIHNIQIDTISVVSRSHNLITYNRFPEYKEGEIWKLEREGKLFEYWSHAMCMIPMDSFPYYAWKMGRMRERKSGWYTAWALENKEIVEDVYNKVKKDGVTRSKDLGEKNRQSDGWWDWKKEKRALESLMTLGLLMVSYREGFQKHYDIPERVVPAGIDTEPLSDKDVPRYVVDTTFRSLGIADYRDVKFYTGSMVAKHFWKNQRNTMEEYLASLVGDILEELDFGQKSRYFIHRNYVKKLKGTKLPSDEMPVKLLTPFDNILRERHYPRSLWDFEYKIECYVPAPDRVYGYFVLPILDQNEFRGRVDAKVHRKTGTLELKSLFIESEHLLTDVGIERFAVGVRKFAQFHGCDQIELNSVSPKGKKSKFLAALG
ncbi:MAG: YcaQ family DNA glycosylase [Candidatus Thorarchaeota archaeon]|nr:YcaQ family DNA glycosylase [Candidatus Thorarchaeota archaeon]